VKSGVVREAKVAAEPMDDGFQNRRILVRMGYHTEQSMAKPASPPPRSDRVHCLCHRCSVYGGAVRWTPHSFRE
jgi:hypothetical protein